MLRFPDIPKELRLKIWQYAMPPPRVVRCNPQHKMKRSDPGNPNLLYVNQESRYETKKRYSMFSLVDNTYVDFSQDIIFIDSFFLKYKLDNTDHEPYIQFLAVDFEYFSHDTRSILQKVCRCSNLRKLFIVIPDEEMLALHPLNNPQEPEHATLSITFIDFEIDGRLEEVKFKAIKKMEKIGEQVEPNKTWPDMHLVKCRSGKEQALAKLPSAPLTLYLPASNPNPSAVYQISHRQLLHQTFQKKLLRRGYLKELAVLEAHELAGLIPSLL